VANVGYATISIIPNLDGFQKRLNAETETASISAGKSGGAGLGTAMIGTLGGLGIGLAVTKAFDIGKSVLEFDSGIQQATTALTSLLHSAPAANALIDQLQKLAQTSSELDTGSAVKLGQILVGMGDPVKNVTADMTALGDATAGVGGTPETLDALARAWGQMAAKGKIQSDEILQMTEQGVPALQLLAKAYGVPTGEMQNMISKGQVLSSDALPKLRDQIEKSFGGADAAAGANSIGGAFDRIKEAAISLAGSAAMPIIKALTPIVANLANALGSPEVQTFVNAIGPKLAGLFTGFGGASGPISKLGPSFMGIVSAGERLWTVLQPIVTQIFDRLRKEILPNLVPLLQKAFKAIGDALDTLGVVVGKLWQIFGPSILNTISIVFKTIVKLISDAFDILEGVFKVIKGLFTGDWSLLWQGVKDIFSGAWHFMTDWLSGQLALWGQEFSAAWAFIKGLFSGLADWFMVEVWGRIVTAAKFYIALTVAPFVLAWDAIKFAWSATVAFFQKIWTDIVGAVKTSVAAIQDAWSGTVAFFSEIWGAIVGAVKTSVDAVVTFFTDLPGWILGALKALPGLALQGLKDFAFAIGYGLGLAYKEILAFPGQVTDLFTSLWHDVTALVSALWSDVTGFFKRIALDVWNALTALPGQVSDLFTSLWHDVTGVVSALWSDVTGFFTRIAVDSWNALTALPGQVSALFTSLWHDVTGLVSKLWSDVTGFFKRLAEDAWNALTALPGQVAGLFTTLWNDAKSAVETGVNATVGFIQSLPGKAMDALSGLGGVIKDACKDAVKWLEQAGEDVINGLINGIKGAWHKVTDLIGSLGHAISSGFSAAIDSHSPSRVFAKHGRDIVAGVVVGVTGTQHQAIGAVHEMGLNIANAFSNGGPVGVGASLANAVGGGRTLNYYAGSGGLSSEEDLFAAAGRARMVW
jgi:tape measure domain-containing protein